MNLITTEINELRQLLKNFQDRTIDQEYLHNCLEVYKQTEKRAKLQLQAMVVAERLGISGLDAGIVKEIAGGKNNKIDLTPRLKSRTAARGQ